MIKLAPHVMIGAPKSATLEAVVTRADGRVEKLGVIARSDFSVLGKIKTAIFGKGRP